MWQKMKSDARGSGISGLREAMELAASKGCVNMGPGVCDLAPNPLVLEAAQKAIMNGHNCYSPCTGISRLRTNIAHHYAARNQMEIAPENVLVTSGATGGLECICKCFLQPGDEVILFEPFYQYHLRQITHYGGIPVFISLQLPDWRFSSEELEKAITSKTRLLVMSNPNNPTGKVFSLAELEKIGKICRDAGVVVVCDEVYEHLVTPEKSHISLAGLPGMFENTLTLSSAGKTFLVTGWRVGWLIGPARVVETLSLKADETYLCAPTPLQHAVADCLAFPQEFFRNLAGRFAHKREQMIALLQALQFTPYLAEGAFYVLAGYEKLGYRDDLEALRALVENFRITAVPGSVFFFNSGSAGMLRFCFAIEDELLNSTCDSIARQATQYSQAAKACLTYPA